MNRLALVLALGLAACGPTLPPEEQAEAEFQQARSARTRQESLKALDRAAILETVRTGASGIGRGERVLRI